MGFFKSYKRDKVMEEEDLERLFQLKEDAKEVQKKFKFNDCKDVLLLMILDSINELRKRR